MQFSNREIVVYSTFDTKIAGYLKKRKFTTEVTESGYLFCRKQVGAISVLVVLW